MRQKLLIPIISCVLNLHASEVVFSSLYTPFADYPSIGDVRTPNEEGGWIVPFRTGAEPSTLSYLTLEHFNDGNPFSRPVNVELFQSANLSSFVLPSPVDQSELIGNLSFTGLEDRETRWPGATTFEHYEPGQILSLSPDTVYFFYIFCDPDATADLLLNPLTPDERVSLLPNWTLGFNFRGDNTFPLGSDVVMEFAVDFPNDQPSSVPEPGAALGAMTLAGMAGFRWFRRK